LGVSQADVQNRTQMAHRWSIAQTEGTGVHLTPSGGRETILLVEDEDSVRLVITTVLRRQGYHVLEAATPREATELFEQHAGQVDLLLADIVMPDMNGPALAQRLVATRPELRVLFISGYAAPTSPFDAANPHVSFLGKPFHVSGLTAKVREALSRSLTRDQPGTKE